MIYASGYATPQLVELKNGETFNGHLVNCDNFMNITLREVYQTNPDGDRFWKLKECYIRGSTVRMCCHSSVLWGVDFVWSDKVPPGTRHLTGCRQRRADASQRSWKECTRGSCQWRWQRQRYVHHGVHTVRATHRGRCAGRGGPSQRCPSIFASFPVLTTHSKYPSTRIRTRRSQ